MRHRLSIFLSLFLLGLLLGLTIGYVRAAWSEPDPSVIPPDGNVAAPLNISGISQSKWGGLLLGVGNPIVALMTFKTAGSEGLDAVFQGPVGIGTSVTSTYRNRNTTGGRRGGLDIVHSDLPATLVLGADASGGHNTRRDAVGKSFSIAMPHFLNGASPQPLVSVMTGSSLSNKNILNIGGGSANFNAATQISFYTATSSQNQSPLGGG